MRTKRLNHVARDRMPMLLFAFAFAVMADPVSSVAYAIEAALRALHGHLGLLLGTMALVVAVISIVRLNYDQLIRRFPEGGGAVQAVAEAFGEGWAFLALGALVVDFVLTISISVSAAASALIAYLPATAGARVPLALGILAVVAGGTWFGHLGRSVFAALTTAFLVVAAAIAVAGLVHPHAIGTATRAGLGGGVSVITMVLAFSVAMAPATGIAASSHAIAQLGQLDDAGRRRIGRATLWLMFVIQGALTLCVAGLALRLRQGIPGPRSTLIANVARAAVGRGALFALFQAVSGLLLLSAASSSFQAGPGLLKALARTGRPGRSGMLPMTLGRTNQHHTPFLGVAVFLWVSAAVVAAAGGREQVLVRFYAVAVFVSFLLGLAALARLSARERNAGRLALNAAGAAVVLGTLAISALRAYPIASIAAAVVIAAVFHAMWVRAGRPRGVALAEAEAEVAD